MIYNLKTPSGITQFKQKVDFLLDSAKKAKTSYIQLEKIRQLRSSSQNSYLHLILGLYALEAGFRMREIKEDLWKRDICRDIFIVEKNGIMVCRSSADLNTKEMTICIERLRNYASDNGVCYLPAPNETEQLRSLEQHLQQYGNAQYL